MKRITILLLPLLLLCGLLSGCIASGAGGKSTEPAPNPTEATLIVPDETTPLPTPSISIETIPEKTDDSDYQLPPGERPTVVPEVK